MSLDYLKKPDLNSSNHPIFEKKVSQAPQSCQDFDQKRSSFQESLLTVENSTFVKNNAHIRNEPSPQQDRNKHFSEQQKQAPLDIFQLKGSYVNFSPVDLGNQDLAFFILNSETLPNEDPLNNQRKENFSDEPFQVSTYFIPLQMMTKQKQNDFSQHVDLLSMKDFPVEKNSSFQNHQILHDKQKIAIRSSHPFLEQEGLMSLTVKDLPQSHLLSQQLFNQQSPLVEWSKCMFDNEMKEDNAIDSIDKISEFDILNKTRYPKNVRGASPNAVDGIEDFAEKGSQDSSMNFMQQQQKVASSTITENITVIESLMTQINGRLKRQTDLRNSHIDFDIKHKDFGDISISLQIQDGEVRALFKGEHYEFRNLLRQNLSSISKLFKDMNLECQEHAINIIKK